MPLGETFSGNPAVQILVLYPEEILRFQKTPDPLRCIQLIYNENNRFVQPRIALFVTLLLFCMPRMKREFWARLMWRAGKKSHKLSRVRPSPGPRDFWANALFDRLVLCTLPYTRRIKVLCLLDPDIHVIYTDRSQTA